MKAGSTTRRCFCRDPKTKTTLGTSCPKLSSKSHGVWALRQELFPTADGTRRAFRRAGYAKQKDAQADLDKLRVLLAIPDPQDSRTQTALGDLLATISADKKAPIPTVEEVKRKIRAKRTLTETITLGQLLDEYIEAKEKGLRATTQNGYAGHIRVHLKPHGGHLVVDDRLGVGDMTQLFGAIEDRAEVVAAENAARREQVVRCKASRPGRPLPEERERLAAERAKLAEMPPFRKVTGPATIQAIRRTLRAALNWAITQQILTFNPAKYVELAKAPGPSPCSGPMLG